jgi:penicillin-binding protein 2
LLTIDKDVQAKVYESIQSLAGEVGFSGGAGAIMDVTTGAVLALTSYPEYDNNLITNAVTDEEKEEVGKELASKSQKFLDRAVSGLYVPGSTVKPFFAYAALEEGVIEPTDYIYSSGALVIKNKYGGPDTVFKDWKKHGYVNMREAIAASSDEYFYQIGGGYQDQKGVGILKLKKYAELFGFSTTTGIDLPDEEHGVIPSPEWKKKVFDEDWLVGNTYHSSIGQYGFQVTPLELLRATAAIANGGYLVTPHLVEQETEKRTNINLNPNSLKVIQEGMRMAVTEDIGTAKGLRLSGIEIAAKTGTAELGITKQQVNSWVTGYFPYDKPKYAFVFVMEKGKRSNLKGATFAARQTIEWMRDNTKYTEGDTNP